MCDIWKANHEKQEIPLETLGRHISAFQKLGVEWVVLSGGEALMHPNLWSFCALLKTIPTKISLLSTGLLLAQHAPQIVDWCDEVIVSLDGSRDIHDAIRNVPHAYDQLAEGVAALKHHAPQFRVTARCVVQQANYHDVPNVIEAAHTLGLDQVSFLAADVSTTAFNRSTPWEKSRRHQICLSGSDVVRFREVIEDTITTYAKDCQSGFIAENPDKLRRLVTYFSALNDTTDFPPVSCNAPWVSTVIEADGTVRPCFFHRPLGNIHDQPLKQILNSPDAKHFRRELDITTDPICRSCVCSLQLGPRASFSP